MTLTEKYIEDGRMEGRMEGRHEGMLMGRIQAFQKLLGREESSTSELLSLPYQALQTLHQRLEAEIHQRMGS